MKKKYKIHGDWVLVKEYKEPKEDNGMVFQDTAVTTGIGIVYFVDKQGNLYETKEKAYFGMNFEKKRIEGQDFLVMDIKNVILSVEEIDE